MFPEADFWPASLRVCPGHTFRFALDQGANREGKAFCELFGSEQPSSETNIEWAFLLVLTMPYFPLFNELCVTAPA
jgi:hypothetical protein